MGAADESESADSLLDALIGGDVYLNMRARLELADMDGREHAEALTLRTRLGYGTKPWHGVSIYGDFENIASPTNGNYFDQVSGDNGKTIVADPETTEVNQAYLKYSNEDLLGTTLIGGRQRLILDDARFIGNVGWRQNEQTYDAGVLHSSMGFENVISRTAIYGTSSGYLSHRLSRG